MQEVYLGLSGAIAAERRMAVIANNLANASSAGFKSEHVAMNMVNAGPNYELLRQSSAADLKVNPPQASFYQTLYANICDNTTDFMPGVARQTGAKTDVMLCGDGFFVVKTPKGDRYTRAGNFAVTKEGILVTESGNPVADRNGKSITIDTPNFTITPNGAVVNDKGKTTGAIQVVRFANPQALEKEGANLFRAKDPSKTPQPLADNDVQMDQGFVEMSNVQIVDELVDMIATQRAYEAYQKLVHASEDMNNQLLGAVAAQ
ncbi:MAG: flagellar basal-body rod protein FlgF [Candidatus Sumerlaeota bacterium]|nr:flagellar basal-body rod protein FlgF [Candidatus Sumerlaeota bacterium]